MGSSERRTAAVSVVIPTHNRCRLLHYAIASAVNQTLQDLEIIVVDDASADDTPATVEGFRDRRIKYIRHEANKGVASARNTGILNSRSRYIAFLDDDDEWLPQKLELQFARLESSPATVAVVYTSSFAIDGLSRRVTSRLPATLRGRIFDSMFIQGSLAPTSTFLCRRECFEKVGLFDTTLEFGEDSDMWLRIAKEFEFDFIEEPLVRFAIPDNKPSLSASPELKIKGKETYLRKYAARFASDPKLHSRCYRELGVRYCFSDDLRSGRKAFLRAIAIYPFDLRHYVNFGLSLLGARAFKRVKMLRDDLNSRGEIRDTG